MRNPVHGTRQQGRSASVNHHPSSRASPPTHARPISSCVRTASRLATASTRRKKRKTETRHDDLRARLRKLGLYGMLARWDEIATKPWLDELLNIEEAERQRRSLARRIRHASIGAFKPIVDGYQANPSVQR